MAPSSLDTCTPVPFLESGRLQIGANYWASHAGTRMWSDWRPDIVEADFARMSEAGLEIVRVFPLWPDFQPLTLLRADGGRPVEFRHGEDPLRDDVLVADGVCPAMLDRFATLLEIAGKHRVQIIVGVVTGWMSGRLFVPPALEGLEPITDPGSHIWQVRLVRTIVTAFRHHPAIRAWDLGNECNVMGRASREQAWVWTSLIAGAIRSADASRPIISGMHSLAADPQSPWSIRDQGELTDLLTTHPYPLFTPHCHREPLHTLRPTLHATVESRLYADLGGKPSFVEEFGNLGPMICGEAETASGLRANLASLWAHDCRAALWWCAFDQRSLQHAPYDWVAIERELGLMREDGSAKPVLAEMRAFKEALAALPFARLPERRIDAVCILTPGQDQWGVAFTTFLLAKQAGLDITFHYSDRALPEARFYLLPSIKGFNALSRRREDELWTKVRAGANVYLSLDGGFLGRFSEATGVNVVSRHEAPGLFNVTLADGTSLPVAVQARYHLRPSTAAVLARDEAGEGMLFKNSFGHGDVFLLTAPVEGSLASVPGAFDEPTARPHWRLYREIFASALSGRALRKFNPWFGVTEHRVDDGGLIAVVINHATQEAADTIAVAPGYSLSALIGRADFVSDNHYNLRIPGNGYAVLQLRPS